MNDIIARLSQPNPVTSDMGADELRQRLLTMQQKLQRANFPVIVLFAGVDAAGKGETANLLQKWMSPRQIVTRAYGERSPEELERPEYWRYWRDLPPHGAIGIFLSAWYSRPLLDRVYENISPERFDEELETVRSFERALTDDGALLPGKLAQEIAVRLAKANGDKGSSARITRALILSVPPSMADGEITAKGNLNFRKLLDRRAALLDRLYAPDDPAVIFVQ